MFKFKRNIVAKVIVTLLVLLSFYGVSYAATGMSESEPNDSVLTATVIPSNYNLSQEIAASIGSAGDVDYYKFIPLNSGGYSIETLGTSDTFGYLYDSNMNVLDACDDQVYPSGPNMELRYELTANSTYYIKVTHKDAASTGDYNLKITPVIYANKEIEPNGSFETASSPEWSECNYPTAATIGTAGDEDYYRFDTSSGGTFAFETVGSTNTYGYLYDSNNNLLASDNDSGEGNNMKIVYALTGYQSYYVKICHASPDGTGSYGLKLSPPDDASTAPDWEGNDFSSATQLTTENYVSHTGLGINNANDTDFFTFTPSADGIYTFQSTGSFNVKGEVYNNDQTILKGDDNSGKNDNFMIDVPLTANQTYYLKVVPAVPGSIGNYGIDIAMGKCLPVPIYFQQPNDNLCWATSSAMAISYFNNDTINRDTDIAMSIAQTKYASKQELYGPDYYKYPSVFNNQATLAECNPYLDEYILADVVVYTAEDKTANEGDLDPSTGLLWYPYSIDTLKKSIDNGYPLLVKVQNAAGGGHMIVVKGYKECADGINVIYNDPLLGEQMANYSSKSGAAYTTFFPSSIDFLNERETNDSVSTATEITSDNNLIHQVTASIRSAGDVDYYKFIPINSGGYSIETLGTTDTFGYLFDSNMNVLDACDDQVYPDGKNMELRYELTANSTYYIKVTHKDAAGTGDYKLKITPVIYTNKEMEPNNSFETAIGSGFGSTTTATISTAGDEDYYSFSVSGSSSFTFETIGSTDTYGYLYDSNHNLLASDNDSGEGNNMKIVYNVTGYKSYYVKICHVSPTGTGSYGLKVSMTDTASTTPDLEGNDFSSATQLTTVNYVTRSGIVGINNANDTDFFTFTPSADGIYTFQSTGNFNVKGEVYNNDQTLIKGDDNSGEDDNFMIDVPLTANQTYYLKVEPGVPGNTGNYYVDIIAGKCLPVPIYLQQPYDSLCWATSAAMAISYFNNDTINRNTDIAKDLAQSSPQYASYQTLFGPDYYKYPSVFNQQAYLADCNKYLNQYIVPEVNINCTEYISANPYELIQKPYSLNTLKKSIDNGYPMLVKVYNHNTGAFHMMTVKGYKECEDGTNVIFNDPLFGEYITKFGDTETWAYTTFYPIYEDIEPNDTKDAASGIHVQTIDGISPVIDPTQGSIGRSGDVDYYSFSADNNDQYFIQITAAAGTCIELYDDVQETPIASATVNAGEQGTNILNHLNVRDNYYIKVSRSDGGTSSYALKLSRTLPPMG